MKRVEQRHMEQWEEALHFQACKWGEVNTDSTVLYSFLFFFFFFCKNKPVKGRATVAFRSAVVSEQDCRLLACQNSFIYSNPSPVGAAPTHACWHTRTRARVHTRGNTKSNKKTIHSRKKGRDVFGALALAGDRSHSRPRVMCTE